MGGDAREDLFKPGEWIDSDLLAGSHETPEHGSGLTTLVAAEEDPVISTDGDTADGALGMIMPTPGLCRAGISRTLLLRTLSDSGDCLC